MSSRSLPKDKVPATLQRLAQACPADQRETAARLEIKALAATATAKGVKPRDDPASVDKVLKLLAQPTVCT